MFNLHEQLIKLQEDEVEIHNDFTFEGIDAIVAKRAINSLTDKLVVNGEAINDDISFDTLRAFARDLHAVDPKLIARGLDMLVAGFESVVRQASNALSTQGSDPTQYAETLDRYAYLFQWIIERGESSASQIRTSAAQTKGRRRKGVGSVPGSNKAASIAEIVPGWKSKVMDLYLLLQQLFQLPLGRIWNSVPERDSFIGVFMRLGHKVLENPAYGRDNEFQMALFNVMCKWVQTYNGLYGAVTLITQNIQHYEHL
ncbi:condensin complex non-SMC subunit Cnd1, partial [Linderina pennispora]